MDGKKWVVAAIITVVVLTMVALILGAILAFQLVREWGKRESDISLPGSFEEIFDRQEAVEEPPMAAEVEGPAMMEPVELDGAVGLLVIDDGDNNMRMLDQFAGTCEEMDIPYNTFTGNGDPKELLEAGMDMLNSGVTGLAVQSPDPEISAVLAERGAELGVPVITLNAGWNIPHSGNETLHISAWGTTEEIGINLMLSAADMVGGKGNVVVLMPMRDETIVEVMAAAQKSWPELKNVKILETVDVDGNPDLCRELVYKLTEEYMPDAFVCVDPMTTDIAIQAMMEIGMETPVIGYATPHELAAHSYSNAVGMFQDPRSLGELAARSLIGLLTGELSITEDEVVVLSNGEGYVVELQDGIPHMHVNPLCIDMYNAREMAEWYR